MKGKNSSSPAEISAELKTLLEAKKDLQSKILNLFGTGTHSTMLALQSRIQNINRSITDLELQLRRA
jgi:hypothetical protein